MDFIQWLEQQLESRGWSQRDLLKRSEMAGYKVSQAQLSRIMSRERQAGPDACISIAYALGISREEVFRARGWLLRTPEESFPPDADPRLIELSKQVSTLPVRTKESLLDLWDATLQTIQGALQEPSEED